jgi:dTDP-4-amino-4,6-dideoxygalactose transaminase
MIRLSKSCLSGEEAASVMKVLENGYLGMGTEVKRFEENLEAFLNSNVAVVSSGTAALQLACQAIGAAPGAEIIVPSLTYIACFQAVSATGALPVPCDINYSDLTLCPESVKNKINNNTIAIMPMHYGGNPGTLEKIQKIAQEHNLHVIEDAAHSFGGTHAGKLIGSDSDLICFSFDGIKNITSGEGGAVASSDPRIIEKIKNYRLLGVEGDSDKRYRNLRSWEFEVKEQGWRYHMSDLFAAIGNTQINRSQNLFDKRKLLANLYVEYLSSNKNIRLINSNFNEIVPHIFVIEILNKVDRNEVIKRMEGYGIQLGIHYFPAHLTSKYRADGLEKADRIWNSIISLPLHPDLSVTNIEFICQTLNEILLCQEL